MKKIIILIIIVGAIGSVLYLTFYREGNKDSELPNPEWPTAQKLQSRTEESQSSLADLQSGKKEIYRHNSPEFSFEYPEGFGVGNFNQEADGSQTVLLQKGNVGFQLTITPFDEDIVLTEARIKEDAPDMAIEQAIQIKIGEAQGVVFLSEDESLGKTREIWWVYNGYLYQITTYPEFY